TANRQPPTANRQPPTANRQPLTVAAKICYFNRYVDVRSVPTAGTIEYIIRSTDTAISITITIHIEHHRPSVNTYYRCTLHIDPLNF
ncbi:hypothetical protein, partial [Proteus vulgaris]|uniref:hypothetical protein n=1 Tax=Proteus vulgaris TaxID=585 RepID=UPI00235F60BD